ncbi:carboxymuconolactone decarboxylase family protein [Clostridiaceae bacterium HSG29]|nr:carboxymuconolactone decarboxylase family protein [Clostridiaceae bacterium HSG29]
MINENKVQEFYKNSYSVKEFYHIIDKALISMKAFKKGKKDGFLDKKFEERINLAVTEVNGCEICNTFHKGKAEKAGITQIEISSLNLGGIGIQTTKEDIAIEFAKHYAKNKGEPKKEEWEKLVNAYDTQKAESIVGAIRVIMLGNAHGIAAGAFLNRLKFKPVEGSNVFNELGVTLSVILFVPILGIKHLFI